MIGAANLAEDVGTLMDTGADVARLRQVLDAAGVSVAPVTAADTELAGAMRALAGHNN